MRRCRRKSSKVKRKPNKLCYSRKWLRNRKEITEYRKEKEEQLRGKCELSNETLYRPCLDHDHNVECPRVRGVISQHFNTFEGYVNKYFNKYCRGKTDLTLPEVLRKLADYYERDWSDRPYHYMSIEKIRNRILRYRKETLIQMLLDDFGVEVEDTELQASLVDLYCQLLIDKIDKENN